MYDPTTGRFDRLDPFFGDQSEPQSFHKYGYVHGDPVNGIDPRGEFTISSLSVTGSFSGRMRASNQAATLSTGDKILRGIRYLGYGAIGAFAATNTYHEFRNLNNKAIATSRGGYSATTKFRAIREDVINKWNDPGFGRKQKEETVDTLHSLNVLADMNAANAWGIRTIEFDNKARWTQGLADPAGIALNTLTFEGVVYDMAEANYFLWGLVNRLANDDGIRPHLTNIGVAISEAIIYRSVAGGPLIALANARGSYSEYETLAGKLAWAEFGWNWAVNENAIRPDETSLANAVPTLDPYQGQVRYEAGPLIRGLV